VRSRIHRGALVGAVCVAVAATGVPLQLPSAGAKLTSFYSVPAHFPRRAGAVIKTQRIGTSGLDVAAVPDPNLPVGRSDVMTTTCP